MFDPSLVRGLVSVDEDHVEMPRESGATIKRYFIVSGDRYRFDFEACTSEYGWQQYDTDQDASYFGVWVHIKDREIVTYAKGDVSVVRCATVEQFQREIEIMNDFYGSPPPAFKVLDSNGVTEYYDADAAFGRGIE